MRNNRINIKPIVSIDTALRIYYTYPEIGNAEMRELFGNIANSTASVYKRLVRDKQAEMGIKTMHSFSVNTKIAYKVWGINVSELEKNRAKLHQLGLVV